VDADGVVADDKQMVRAINALGYSRRFGETAIVNTLLALEKHESPLVREAACETLRPWKYPCAAAPEPGGAKDQPPSVLLQDLTRPSNWPRYRSGDRFRIAVSGPPNQDVYRSAIEGSRTETTRLGVTDAHGHFAFEDSHRVIAAARTEVWSVGNTEASPAFTYVSAQSGEPPEIVATPVGKARDQYGMAISVLSAADTKVTTYAAVQLSYPASLYYDIKAASTVFQNGKAVKTGMLSGEAFVSQILEAPLISWSDYFIKTKAYAAAFFSAGNFLNPLRFADGSCYGLSSDCQIVPLGAPVRVASPTIFVGSTGADQTAVPQNLDFELSQLGAKEKASVLDSLLARGNQADDSYTIAMIRTVAAQHQFPPALLENKMRELAAHETRKVRQAACKVLGDLKKPCPTSQNRTKTAEVQASAPASRKPTSVPTRIIDPDPLQRAAIPKYLVYCHFLNMVHLLDQSTHSAGGSHTDTFTWPFITGKPARTQIDLLKKEARSFAEQMAITDKRAKNMIADFRRRTATPIRQESSLPPAPAGIYQLEALRTAIAVQHMVSLQSRLGRKRTAGFEAFLAYEFTAHTSLESFAHSEDRH
jgi:hypothetical protein